MLLSTQNYLKRNIEYERNEILNNISFSSSYSTSSAYVSLSHLFFCMSGSNDYRLPPIETISKQKIVYSSDNYINWYQIPFENRGHGVIPNTFFINTSSFTISDDGYGNLYHNQTQVGNIFYTTGFIFLNSSSVSGSNKPWSEIINSGSLFNLEYKREVFFEHEQFNFFIESENNYISNNNTFSGSNCPNPFLTGFEMTNERNEVIIRGKFSIPIEIKHDIFVNFDILK